MRTKLKSVLGRIYNWQPDLPDARDHKFALARPGTAALPSKVDLRQRCSPVKDQGQLGSCTGNALAAAMEFLGYPSMSRLFIYYVERHMENTVADDAGAVIRDGIQGLHDMGCCTEDLCPYDTSKFTEMPAPEAFADAQDRQIKSYRRISGLSAMKQCLAEGHPFVFGFTVYQSFESDQVAQDGLVQKPGPGEQSLGGHAVLCVGYDEATQRVLVRNSWGAEWGDGGYFTLPYTYIGSRDLADDMWTIRADA